MNSQRLLWLTIGLLTVAAALVAVVKVWPLLNPAAVFVAPVDPECDLRAGPCVGDLPDGGRVQFAIAPRNIPAVKPLQLTVVIEDLDAREVEVDFAGVDMNMGFNRPKLQQVAPGRYQGAAMLPVCIRARMTWEARVLLHTPRGLQAVPFRFDTYQPGSEPKP
jgi:hypothetical protein